MSAADRSIITSCEISRWLHRLTFLLLALLVVLAPLVRGGNRQVALIALLGLALALLALVLAVSIASFAGRPPHVTASSHTPPVWQWMVLFVALSPLWVGLTQLVAIPLDWWSRLPGRQPYLHALQAAGVDLPLALPLSLNPSATQAALWAGLIAGSAFLAATRLNHRQAERLFHVLLAAALIQAVLGALQFSLGPQSVLYFGAPAGSGVIGSFANRNHLAEFLAMVLPAWFYLLVRHPTHSDLRVQWIPQSAQRPLWILLGFCFIVIILTSASRGGSIAMTTVLALSLGYHTLISYRHLTRTQIVGIVLLIITLFALLVGFVELDRLTRRLADDVVQTDAEIRWGYTLSTLQAGLAFWPWGSGLGTFESVFPRFQGIQSVGYINQAHNDYAQVLMEAGLLGVLVAVVLVALVIHQGVRIVRHARHLGRWPAPLQARCYALFGVIGMAIHSWGEYNLYTPALAITAAALLGIYLRPLEATNSKRS